MIKKLNDYFPTDELRGIVESPLKKAKIEKYEITARLSGGGIHSQAEALRHGISRALIESNAELRGELKPLGFLMRDPRMKERRKVRLEESQKKLRSGARGSESKTDTVSLRQGRSLMFGFKIFFMKKDKNSGDNRPGNY